jgi:RNA polymerase subunit RPABC4/transcription elongation factor Spt4
VRGLRSYDPEAEYQRLFRWFSRMKLPRCPACGSFETATVQVGLIRLTIRLAVTCPTFKLLANGPKPGDWFCRECETFFDEDDEAAEECDVRFQRGVTARPD